MSASILDTSPSLARVRRGDLCAGCGLCAGIAPARITMVEAAPGFLRPSQSAPLEPEQEATVAAVCPGLGQRVAAEGRTDSKLWGPFLAMHTGWATNPELRHAGSSGGALSAVLIHLLASGQVDAVLHVAPDPKRPAANRSAISRTPQEIIDRAGSRYAPSAPLEMLDTCATEHRAQGTRFALAAKPCDAAALRALMAREPTIAATFPVIISFFCAGVPSHSGGEAVLAALGSPDAIAFRYRGMGWPGKATAIRPGGAEVSMSYHESWGGILSKHVQHRCKICADGTGAAADLVCADAWEADAAGYPKFDEAPGISLIVARTALGQKILEEAATDGSIVTTPFDVEELTGIQPGQRERRRALLARLTALRVVGRPVPYYEGLQVSAVAWQNPILRNIKNFIGMLRRSLVRKKG